MIISKIISGGQTGVDQGALDYALENSVPCGGWCPKGRLCENGKIPEKYPVRECESKEYPYRTEKNVIDSDGTLIIIKNSADRGTGLTKRLCEKHNKPIIIIDIIGSHGDQRESIQEWINTNNISVLNIAGNRESFSEGIQEKTKDLLLYLFS